MMKDTIRKFAHAIIIVMGIGLMIGGIITGRHGAVVAGMIVAAVNVQPLISLVRLASTNKKNE